MSSGSAVSGAYGDWSDPDTGGKANLVEQGEVLDSVELTADLQIIEPVDEEFVGQLELKFHQWYC